VTSPNCSVDGCTNDTSKGGKGLCSMHYARLRRTGDPGDLGTSGYLRRPGLALADRVYPRLRLREATGCWEWTGALSEGYGVIGLPDNKHVGVHRWVYEDLVAEIPAGLVIDHLCANRRCANPEHLDPVTRAVNNARGDHGLRVAS
jgi:hypothetical protein